MSGWTFVPLLSLLAPCTGNGSIKRDRVNQYTFIQIMASSFLHPLQPRGSIASLHFWDSVFFANLIPSWHFFRQDDVYSENKYSMWARICLSVGYVSEPVGNTCRTFSNVSRYTTLLHFHYNCSWPSRKRDNRRCVRILQKDRASVQSANIISVPFITMPGCASVTSVGSLLLSALICCHTLNILRHIHRVTQNCLAIFWEAGTKI